MDTGGGGARAGGAWAGAGSEAAGEGEGGEASGAGAGAGAGAVDGEVSDDLEGEDDEELSDGETPRPLRVGDRVIARHPRVLNVHAGSILTVQGKRQGTGTPPPHCLL